MLKGRVGVLRGGPSSEYDVSLKSGFQVMKHVPEGWEARDIFIDKQGKWHLDGVEKSPEKIMRSFDVVFNAMHGEFGEDGKVQSILESLKMPFNGSRSMPSAMAMNKIKTKEIASMYGIKTPKFTFVKKQDYTYGDLAELYASLPRPIIVKPAYAGSSLGISLVNSFEDLVFAVNEAFKISDTVLLEEFISGREATCGVLDHSNGNDVYALYPVEITYDPKKLIWDYESKYTKEGHCSHCPSTFSHSIKKELQNISHKVHSIMGLSHYSRSDFIITPEGEIYFLEVNTLPGLTETSLLPLSLKAIGIEMPKFIDHVLTLALKRK